MKNGLNKILAILMLYSAVSLFSNAENDAMKHDTIDYIENTQFVFSYPSFSREVCDTLWEGESFYKSITCMDDGAILVFCQGHNTISVIDFQFIDKIECKDKYTTTKRGAYRNTNAIIQEFNQDTLLRYYREDTYRSGIDIYYFNVKEQDTIKYNRILDSVKKQITAIDDSLEMAERRGNVRAVIGAGGVLEEVNGYYPYGGITGAPASGVQPLKYGGKELDRENGLDWLDFEARHYDPMLPHFNSIDRLDYAAYNHDKAYDINDAHGIGGALFSSKVKQADHKLAVEAFIAAKYATNLSQRKWAILTGTVFSIIQGWK